MFSCCNYMKCNKFTLSIFASIKIYLYSEVEEKNGKRKLMIIFSYILIQKKSRHISSHPIIKDFFYEYCSHILYPVRIPFVSFFLISSFFLSQFCDKKCFITNEIILIFDGRQMAGGKSKSFNLADQFYLLTVAMVQGNPRELKEQNKRQIVTVSQSEKL